MRRKVGENLKIIKRSFLITKSNLLSVVATLSDNPFSCFRYALKEGAEDGREKEGRDSREDDFNGCCPRAEGTFVGSAEPGAEELGDIGETEHVAEVHTVAGLGDRGKEWGGTIELTEEEHPADGHQGYAEGVVVPRHFPDDGKVNWAFNGECGRREG